MKFRITSAVASALIISIPAWAQQSAQPDPQMKAVLDKLASLNGKPIPELTAEEARKQPSPADAVAALMKDQGKKPEEVGNIDNNTEIVLSGGQKLNTRIYTPKGDGPFPVILYIHGGGWVLADLDTYDGSARALCNATNAVIVSVEYRHAPEHKFPAAHLDTFGAYQWLLQNAEKIKGDPRRIALVGESAGGNMACAISMMAKEKGIQLPVHQVLVYPVADTSLSTPSSIENAAAKPLNVPTLKWFFSNTLAKPEDAKNPRLNLVAAGNELKGLPGTTIITAQIDPLRSEGEALAKALEGAGVKVNFKNYDGVTHEFFGMGGVVDKAKEAVALVATDLKTAFGS